MATLVELREAEQAALVEVMYLEAGDFAYVQGLGKAIELTRNRLRHIRQDIEELTERGAA